MNINNFSLIIVIFSLISCSEVNDEPNDTLQNAVKTLWQTDKQFVVLYNIAMLQFNILEHEKVPQHIRLTDDEKTNIYNG